MCFECGVEPGSVGMRCVISGWILRGDILPARMDAGEVGARMVGIAVRIAIAVGTSCFPADPWPVFFQVIGRTIRDVFWHLGTEAGLQISHFGEVEGVSRFKCGLEA